MADYILYILITRIFNSSEILCIFSDETNRNKIIRKTVNFADVFIDNVIIDVYNYNLK